MSHYRTLGLENNATQDEIKTAFRRESMKHHPDRHPNADEAGKKMAEKAFLKAKEAYDVLSDPVKRRLYDASSGNSFKKTRQESEWEHAKTRKSHDFMEDFAKAWAKSNGTTADPWDSYSNRKSEAFKARYEEEYNRSVNKNASTDITISMEDSFTGCKTTISYHQTPESKRTVEVSIPSGIKSGTIIQCKGGGYHINRERPAGDLFVTVKVDGGNNWHREEDDLYLATPISALDLITGGTVIVPTIDGATLEVSIRPGTSLETKIRIVGRGMPVSKGKGRGDMFLDLKVFVPKLDMNNQRVVALLDELKYLI